MQTNNRKGQEEKLIYILWNLHSPHPARRLSGGTSCKKEKQLAREVENSTWQFNNRCDSAKNFLSFFSHSGNWHSLIININ